MEISPKIPKDPKDPKEWTRIIDDGAKSFGINLSEDCLNHFCIYSRELSTWNRKINLTAITEPFEIAVKHFIDSLIPAQMIRPDAHLLDIGSGAGFPGMVLKLVIPSLSVTLIDASQKKVNFLNHLIRILDLSDIRAFHLRAEQLPTDTHSLYDVVISRALGSLDAFALMALPVLSENGTIVALKGKISNEEIESAKNALSHYSAHHPSVNPSGLKYDLSFQTYTLPYINAERSLIFIRRATPY